jgi:membrane protein required for colicin V production
MLTHLNWVDDAILLIFLVSVLAGLMRGLVKEVISLFTWIAAFIVAILFSTRVASMFTGSDQVQSAVSNASNNIGMNASQSVSVLSIGVSFLLLFVATLIIGSIINYIISRAVESGGISFINRLLGGVFGLARGFLIILVGIFLIQLSPVQDEPWWQASQFVKSYQPSVKWLGDTVSPGFENLKAKVDDTLKNVNTQQMFQR